MQLCFRDESIRRLAVKPFFIGLISYVFSVVGAVMLHPVIMSRVSPQEETLLVQIWALFVWLGVSFALLLGTVVLTLLIVLVCCSYYHQQIALRVLQRAGIPVSEESLGAEIWRTTVTELLKLLWLGPLFVIAFVLGLIPVFAPIAFLLASILLAYQFFDYPLEGLKLGAFKRFNFIFSHPISSTVFGAALLLLGAVPFLALFLPPAAVAGASWLITEEGWYDKRRVITGGEGE